MNRYFILIPFLIVVLLGNVGAYETIEEARFALRTRLLDASKKCTPVKWYFKEHVDEYPEVAAFIIKTQNGYEITEPVTGSGKDIRISTPQGAVESMHTHPFFVERHAFWSDKEDHAVDLGPSGVDIARALQTGVPSSVLDCTTGDIYGVSSDGIAYKAICDPASKTCNISFGGSDRHTVHGVLTDNIYMKYSQAILEQRLAEWLKEHGLDEWVCNAPAERQNWLRSFADLFETGEDIAEVRQDMREKRHERKAKEQAERERKAAEEAERLRQQQLEAQRKKEQKKSDKKQDVTKDEPKNETPTPVPTTADVDFSTLNSLISQQVSLLRGIISSGQKATSAQRSQFNSLNSQYAAEFDRLKAQIGNISDAAIRNQYYSQLASINSRMNSEVDPLLAQGKSLGYFT